MSKHEKPETAAKDAEPVKTRFAKDQLKAFVERIERLEEEKKSIADDIRDVFAEAKGNGFDVKALRAVVRLRKQDQQERDENDRRAVNPWQPMTSPIALKHLGKLGN